MARGAIARLYDVDDDTVVFKRFNVKNKYDLATVTFRAKKGRLVDLQKMHESFWATRLSGGTSSGVICLEVNAVGTVSRSGNESILHIDDSDLQFVLVNDVRAKPDDARAGALRALQQAVARGEKRLSVTGYVDRWVGRWPGVLSRPATARPRLMVTQFTAVEKEDE
ncbi:MAG: hypothetical protein ABGZ53_32905 [Fuerstiella sp.]